MCMHKFHRLSKKGIEQRVIKAKENGWVNIVILGDAAYHIVAPFDSEPYGRHITLHPDGFHHILPD